MISPIAMTRQTPEEEGVVPPHRTVLMTVVDSLRLGLVHFDAPWLCVKNNGFLANLLASLSTLFHLRR